MFLFKLKKTNRLINVSNKGFSLVETVIYIGLMTTMLFSLLSLIDSASKTNSILKSSRNIERSAINVMNNISLYTGDASVIDMVNTNFNIATGSISLSTYSKTGVSTTTKIYLLDNQVMLSQNNIVVGPLSLSDVRVTSLIFRNMSTSTFNGFKVEMKIDNASSSFGYLSNNFYGSYILR